MYVRFVFCIITPSLYYTSSSMKRLQRVALAQQLRFYFDQYDGNYFSKAYPIKLEKKPPRFFGAFFFL
jgi:hypothetical protein